MAETDQGDKTEAPTPKKLEDTRKKGQVAQSREVATLFLLGGALVWSSPLGGAVWGGLTTPLRTFLERPHLLAADPAALADLLTAAALAVGAVVAFPLLTFFVAGVVAHLGQTGLLLSTDPLTPKFSKLSPLEGLKRVFGPKAALEAVKSVLKIGVVAVAAWFALQPLVGAFVQAGDQPPAAFMRLVQAGVMRVAAVAAGVALIVAIIDVIYQRHTHHEKLRMTRQQVKDEHKESDGDPQIKQRIRQLRAERARQRLAAEIPQATVVITNPTHVSVALRYDQGTDSAPRIVGKGVDSMALHIRSLAREHGVPIIENPPLARALNHDVEVGRTIPQQHFEAVAQIIGFVLSQRAR